MGNYWYQEDDNKDKIGKVLEECDWEISEVIQNLTEDLICAMEELNEK